MTSQAETVELLVRKAKFEPQVALAVAEAIDNAMTDSKLVTVPILDARLAELRQDFAKELATTREGLSKEISANNERIGIMGERLMKEISVTSERLMKEISGTSERLMKEISGTNERLLKEIGVTNERTKADLARWVLLAMLGSTALGMGATAITNAIQHMH